MLGEQIGQMQGKVVGRRVLPGEDYRYVKMEVTVEENGELYGSPVTEAGTYVVFERVPEQLYGTGQGVIGLASGEGAIWNGHGVGTMTGEGMSMKMRFSIAVQAPKEGKLAPLNQVLVVGEHDVDDEGNTQTRMWEWK
ncbi:MAG: hypothetical protein M0R74_01865 [Dehalococcoidia bacterium]|nr:hypothetical protein [Dehalococcoidia bacterium]